MIDTRDAPLSGGIDQLQAIMAQLRDPHGGCPWDLAQSFETIAPYTIEEAYEVADAIRSGDLQALKDELGDLQLQVVYHARLAEEKGAFTLHDVLAAICEKMVRRHPHVFGDGETSPGWEALKAAERNRDNSDQSALAGVALALPALKRAEKIQARAARVGFDWPDAGGPRLKISEELQELDEAADDRQRAHELGDLLFSVVNYARHLNIDAEAALQRATERFQQRFRCVEQTASKPLNEMGIDALEALWQAAKQRLREG